MAFVTYILAVALHYGLRSDFRPDILGVKASTGLFVVLLDFLFVKLGCYLLNIQVCPVFLVCRAVLPLSPFLLQLTDGCILSVCYVHRAQVNYLIF